MTAFRLYLAAALLALVAYTGYVAGRDGLDLLPVFFGAIADGRWPGQFNADFMSLLALSALWTGWRNLWSPLGWLLALAAFLLGGVFLMGHLLILLHREQGDMKRVLLGARADEVPHRRWTD